jgi:hypothetical protein
MEKRLESERVSGLAREILRLLLDSPESHNEVSWSASFGGDQFQFAKMTFKAKSRTPGSLREMRSLEAAVESLVTEGALRLVKDSDGWRSWKLAPLADAVAEQFPVTTRIDWGSWDSLD